MQNGQAIKRGYDVGNRFTHRHFGMTMTQASVLLLLMHEGRKTMSEVAAALGVSKSAASQLLDGLVECGFVDRTHHDDDKRVVYVTVSRRGLRHFKHVRQAGGKQMLQLFDLLDDDELEQIETITAKLAQRVKEHRR